MKSETSTANKVRTLELKMSGNTSIHYFYFLVDFAKADGISISSSKLVSKEGTENDMILELNCSLSGTPSETESMSYMLNYFEQLPEGKTLTDVEVTVGSQTKKGDVTKAKIKTLDDEPEVSQAVDHPRLDVILSSTTGEYYVVVLAKTANTNSKTLSLSPKENGENVDLEIAYNNPSDHNPSHASEHLVASNAIISTKDQYHKVYKVSTDQVTINYNKATSL